MASYHCSVKVGGKGKASGHAAYIAREGHYEKREINTTRYVFVTGENPSGIPDSFVVSESEAKGSDDAIVGDEDHNDKKFEAQP